MITFKQVSITMMRLIRMCSVKIIDHAEVRTFHPEKDIVKIRQPSFLETPTLGETLRQSLVDVLLLCFFAVVLTTVSFLKFFRSDI